MVDVRANNAAYEAFRANLQQSGIKTTSINMAKEADFGDYGAALGDNVKKEILDSFDCDQDYELQKKIAGFYTDTNYLNQGKFIEQCKKNGLTVSCRYEKTSHISDYKAGNFGNNISNSGICIYEISDGMGGSIKIADANGNGALESEEIFMNQILGDINTEIGQIANTTIHGGSASGGSASGNVHAVSNPISMISTVNQTQNQAAPKISQKDFNKRVEQYIDKGMSRDMAVIKAKSELGANLQYTGKM